MIFKPWNKDIEQMFLRISRNGKAYVSDPKITRMLGRMHPELENLITIWHRDREGRSVLLPEDDVMVVPKPVGRHSKTRLFEIYRLF